MKSPILEEKARELHYAICYFGSNCPHPFGLISSLISNATTKTCMETFESSDEAEKRLQDVIKTTEAPIVTKVSKIDMLRRWQNQIRATNKEYDINFVMKMNE